MADAATFAAGRLLGRYRILRLLGSGAMGDVYLAEDPQIERRLALKTVRVADGRAAELEDRKRRLLREAKAAGRLIHPHVVTLFDAGEADGVLYLAFEYVDGSDLAQRLESRPPLALREILRIGREAAEALDFAHQQGIVHRDIKPSNILLDRRGRVKVADFGIARLAGQSTELTMAGSVVGSPFYLSPEQVRGEDLDGRSDVFSLGVVLYEMVGRRRPFDGDTLTTLVYQILNQEPKPLPPLAPGLAPHLEPLLARLMAKDRDRRFASAAEAAEEIRRLETTLPAELLDAPPSEGPADPDATFLLASRPGARAATPAAAASIAHASRAAGASSADQPTSLIASPATSPPMKAAAAGGGPAKRSLSGPLLLAGGALLLVAVVALGAWQLVGKRLLRPAAAPVEPAPPGTSEPSSEHPRAPAEAPPPPSAQREPVPPRTEPAPESEREPEPEPAAEPTKPAVTPATAPPRPAPSAPSAPPVTRPRPVEPRAPAPAPSQTPSRPAPAEEAPAPARSPQPLAASRPQVDREMTTGLALTFQVKPEDAFLRLRALDEARSIPIGQAADYATKGRDARPYRLPAAGDFVLSLRKEGLDNYDILIHAEEGRGQTPIVVDLAARSAAASRTVLAVREGVTLRGEPETARVSVDGVDRGAARDFAGGIGGRKVLLLEPGLRRIEISAPGLGSQVFEVQVSPAADKERETLRFKLP
jgi:serine/threonine-protein kinase